MVFDLSQGSSLINSYLAELRDKEIQKDRQKFRKNLERLGSIFAYEISKTLPFQIAKTNTPLGVANSHILTEQPVIATILRAGIPFYNGMLDFFDKADSAFISSHRVYSQDHSHFEIKLESLSCPSLKDRIFIVTDPMLATGSSLVNCLEEIYKIGKPKETYIASVIASQEGINCINKSFPDIKIWVGAIDQELNKFSYIVPGIGDVGDLSFGEKLQK